jgi:hypothetical protein
MKVPSITPLPGVRRMARVHVPLLPFAVARKRESSLCAGTARSVGAEDARPLRSPRSSVRMIRRTTPKPQIAQTSRALEPARAPARSLTRLVTSPSQRPRSFLSSPSGVMGRAGRRLVKCFSDDLESERRSVLVRPQSGDQATVVGGVEHLHFVRESDRVLAQRRRPAERLRADRRVLTVLEENPNAGTISGERACERSRCDPFEEVPLEPVDLCHRLKTAACPTSVGTTALLSCSPRTPSANSGAGEGAAAHLNSSRIKRRRGSETRSGRAPPRPFGRSNTSRVGRSDSGVQCRPRRDAESVRP